jgi:hypothetical protein
MTNVSIGDPESDYRIIIDSFMKELCTRDDEHNRGVNIHQNLPRNVFNLEAIRQRVLKAYSIEYILQFLRRHLAETKPNEPFELLENETHVKLTNAGRVHCDEYGL